LPGIGDYTAAAIASIAFDLPHAVLDGNVFRVLSRIFDDFTNVASTSGRKHFSQIAGALLDPSQPGLFNQATMELGATVCLPRDPQCLLCPVSRFCGARAAGHQNELPVKIAPQKSVNEHRTLFWIEQRGEILLWQRPSHSRLMPGFWELPERAHLAGIEAGQTLGSFRHSITFHNYRFEVIEAAAPATLGDCQWISLETVPSLPVSTVFRKAQRLTDVLSLR
jgi:A/G-specific adenine glycosylase